MADMALPTIVEGNNGFGGAGMGAGFIGGLVLGSIWNGGFGGWGGNRAGQVGADVALQNSIQNVGNQVQGAALSQLQSANQLGLQVANSVNANTVAQLQGNAALGQQMCCCCNNLGQQIDAAGDQTTAAINATNIQGLQNTQQISNGLANLGQAVSNQGYQNQLATKDILAAMAQHDGEISRQIYEQGCQSRELQREIQYQNTRDQLAQCQSERAALLAQANTQAALNAQTTTIINAVISALKPTTTAAAGA